MRRFARFVRRFVCLGLGAAVALAFSGCTPTGNYQVSWNFFSRADGTGDIQEPAAGCGFHGVDAVFIQGTSGGNGATEIWLCTPGQVTGTVATGDWTFRIQQMDVRGTIFGDPVTTTTMTVSQGGTAVFPTVTLTPRPECSDAVDNDHDGLVDRDDPGCAAATDDPHDTTLESSAGPASRLDGGTPDAGGADGGSPDGGATDGPAPDADLDGPAGDASGTDTGLPDDAAVGG